MVRLLLEHGASVDVYDNAGRTALHRAAKFGHTGVVRVLLNSGADLAKRANGSMTALHLAASSQYCAPPDSNRAAFLSQRASVALPSFEHVTAINNGFRTMPVAVESVPGKGLGLIARESIASGSIVAYYLCRIYQSAHHRPSAYAIMRNDNPGSHEALMDGSGLPEDGFDIYDIDASMSFPPPGDDGIPYVGMYSNEITEGSSQSYNVKLDIVHDDVGRNRSLHKLVTTSDVAAGEEVAWYYGRGYQRIGYRVKRPPGESFCSVEDNAKMTRLLLEFGAEVEAKAASNGYTALHMASQIGDAHLVEVLAQEARADVDARAHSGQMALHVAALTGDNAEVAHVLLENGAAVDAQDDNGLAPLHYAASKGHARIVKALLESGATVDMRMATAGGLTALDLAASKGHLQVVRTLLQGGAADTDGLAQQLASSRGYEEVVRTLLKFSSKVCSEIA